VGWRGPIAKRAALSAPQSGGADPRMRGTAGNLAVPPTTASIALCHRPIDAHVRAGEARPWRLNWRGPKDCTPTSVCEGARVFAPKARDTNRATHYAIVLACAAVAKWSLFQSLTSQHSPRFASNGGLTGASKPARRCVPSSNRLRVGQPGPHPSTTRSHRVLSRTTRPAVAKLGFRQRRRSAHPTP
jgi:hypothetical protein